MALCLMLLGCMLTFPAPAAVAALATLPHAERSIVQLRADLDSGRISSVRLVSIYLTRIALLNPQLHAVIAVNSHALDDARSADRRRSAGFNPRPLEGIPILVKDNIDVAGMPTTAGSLALLHNVVLHDAPLVARLRDSGAVILGKTNLSEWANFRSTQASSGWSAVGGLTRNPYALDRTACGSSSGSAVAVAADLAPAAIGTETDGSITCPASMNGLVGLKPTVGLVSRTGIVPISRSQDTAGPLARSVADAALVLSVIAGTDPTDPATAAADSHLDARVAPEPLPLRGARLGVLRFGHGFSAATLGVFESGLAKLRAQGAVLIDIHRFDPGDMRAQEHIVLLTEFKAGLAAYLASAPPAVRVRNLGELIEFDRDEPREFAWFGQELFAEAEGMPGLQDPAYATARYAARQHAGPEGIDRMLADNDVVALLAPTTGPAWLIDRVNGDGATGSSSALAAVAGYPHLTVPMGSIAGLPVGMSFIAGAWSEPLLLRLGTAFETAAGARSRPAFAPTALSVPPQPR